VLGVSISNVVQLRLSIHQEFVTIVLGNISKKFMRRGMETMIIKSKEINGCHMQFVTNDKMHSKLTDYGEVFKEDITPKLNILFNELMKTVSQFQ